MAERVYTVEVLNKPIAFGDIVYDNSVKLSEYAAHKKIGERTLGYLTPDQVYEQLQKTGSICVDKAYVKDFSLSEYKRKYKLADERLKLGDVTARGSFFDCDLSTDFSYALFKGNVDFKECVFQHGNLNFSQSEFETERVSFTECKFNSHRISFEYTKFTCSEINFEHAQFAGETVSFVNAGFEAKEVNFKRCNFGASRVKFHFASFGNGVKLFQRIRANGPVFDFRRVSFGVGKVDFRRALFSSSYVTFEESEIESGKITFRMAHFDGGDLSFRKVNFGQDEINFDHVDFDNRTVNFEHAVLADITISQAFVRSNLDLRVKRADKIDLNNSYLYAITDLNFPKPEAIKSLRINGVRNLGKMIVRWNENQIQRLVENTSCTSEELADQFNIIKSNFYANGQYNDEDFAYICYKRHEHSDLREKALQKYPVIFRPFVYLGFALRHLVLDKMGLFATSPWRVLLSMVVTIVSFSALYILFFITGIGEVVNAVDASDGLDLIDKSLYHSAITFFTIGYGDFYPTGFSRLISAIEGWSGVFLMSYFTVAFVRKVLR